MGEATEIGRKVRNGQKSSDNGDLGFGLTAARATKYLVEDLDFARTGQYRELINSDKPSWKIVKVVASRTNLGEPAESSAMRGEDAEAARVPGPAESLVIGENRPVAQRDGQDVGFCCPQ
jgi:hypothetical protein